MYVHLGWLNDFWMFNISNSQWTWVSGGNTLSVPGAYGTKGIPSIGNYPGGRFDHSMIFNPKQNCLYVFGGEGMDASGLRGESTKPL